MIITLFIIKNSLKSVENEKQRMQKMSPTEKFITKKEPAKNTLRNEKSNVAS